MNLNFSEEKCEEKCEDNIRLDVLEYYNTDSCIITGLCENLYTFPIIPLHNDKLLSQISYKDKLNDVRNFLPLNKYVYKAMSELCICLIYEGKTEYNKHEFFIWSGWHDMWSNKLFWLEKIIKQNYKRKYIYFEEHNKPFRAFLKLHAQQCLHKAILYEQKRENDVINGLIDSY
jgi:hypothetical protein